MIGAHKKGSSHYSDKIYAGIFLLFSGTCISVTSAFIRGQVGIVLDPCAEEEHSDACTAANAFVFDLHSGRQLLSVPVNDGMADLGDLMALTDAARDAVPGVEAVMRGAIKAYYDEMLPGGFKGGPRPK